MFLNIIVSTLCAVVIFHSQKPTGSTNIRFNELAATLAGKKAMAGEW